MSFIHYKDTDTFLDPCKLPKEMTVGQKVRFSGTLFNILNTEHMNLDLFPLELSTIERIEERP
jgi:starvation-inducible outer membrane lipoprotein